MKVLFSILLVVAVVGSESALHNKGPINAYNDPPVYSRAIHQPGHDSYGPVHHLSDEYSSSVHHGNGYHAPVYHSAEHHTPVHHDVYHEPQHKSYKEHVPKHHGGYKTHEEHHDKPYAFEYAVQDPHYGGNFGHSEQKDGYVTKGSYFVDLPDGRRQIVNYYVDETGYNAEVTYEGEINYDDHHQGAYQKPHHPHGAPHHPHAAPHYPHAAPEYHSPTPTYH